MLVDKVWINQKTYSSKLTKSKNALFWRNYKQSDNRNCKILRRSKSALNYLMRFTLLLFKSFESSF